MMRGTDDQLTAVQILQPKVAKQKCGGDNFPAFVRKVLQVPAGVGVDSWDGLSLKDVAAMVPKHVRSTSCNKKLQQH